MKRAVVGFAILGSLLLVPPVRAGLDEIGQLLGLVIKASFDAKTYLILAEKSTGQMWMEAPGFPRMPVVDMTVQEKGATYTAEGADLHHVIQHAGPIASYGILDPVSGRWLSGPFPITPD